ncbi:hypothetical protein GGF46_001645 [Coemansia sp. RSA 552]|nr:hypothetical protein GGF46_001645 [Coemansia sp. RSA 552]
MATENTAVTANGKVYWVPLESSPESMTKMVHSLGADQAVAFSDVWGLDEDLLAMVSQPVHALIFLFPSLPDFTAKRKAEAESSDNSVAPSVWFMKQTVGNACGTMAVMHALGNTQSVIPMEGALAEFFARTKDLSPPERGAALENSQSIASEHAKSAAEGQTAAPAADASIDHHYVAFVKVDGHLYELDGALSAPINHGPSTDVLRDGARAIQARIKQLPSDSLDFSVIALGADPNSQA